MRYNADNIPPNMAAKMSEEDRRALGIAGSETGQVEAEFDEPTYLIGIDPGTDTGLAVYDPNDEKLVAVKSGPLIAMCWEMLSWHNDHAIFVRVEDARKRKWYGKQSNAKAQGAGSIKRDCKIWEEILEYYDINYEMVHPVKGATKLDAETFQSATGWEGQTNEHKRDAGMLVYGLNQ